MTKGEKFLEKEGIDDMIIAVNEKGEQVFVSDLIDKALNEQLILSGVVKSLPTKEEIYSSACEYARNVQNPNRNIILTLRQAFKNGAMFIKNQVAE